MNSRIALFLVFLQFLTYCRNAPGYSGQGTEAIDIVSALKNKRTLYLSNIAEDIYYVPLSGEGMPAISGINFFSIANNYMLISDMHECYLFDTAGQYVRSIGIKGRGPGEYTSIMQIAIGEDRRIFIYCLRKLLEFDIDGSFRNESDFYDTSSPSGYLGNWLYLNDGTFLAQVSNNSGSEKHKAVVLNTQGELISGFQNNIFFEKERGSSTTLARISSIYFFNDSIRYKELFNDTLFTLTKVTTMIPMLSFNLGSYKVGYMESLNDLLGKKKIDREFARIRDIFETRHFLLFDLQTTYEYLKRDVPVMDSNGMQNYYTTNILGVYDKYNRETYFVDITKTEEKLLRTGLFNDIDGGPKFYPRFRMGENRFAMPIQAYDLKAYVASESFRNATAKFPEKKKALEDLANSLSESDNPILMVVRMK